VSLKTSKKNTTDLEHAIEFDEMLLDISRLIIPFSVAFESYNLPDIYTGDESVSFDKKDSKFKEILINEFIND
jgi:hypothetical protein